MTIRFFILQSHYRSTLDFSNEALQSAQKGLKRLWDAYEILQKMNVEDHSSAQVSENELDIKIQKLLQEFDEFMDDDFNTAKVLGNMFELVSVINSMKDKLIEATALSSETFSLLQSKMKIFVEDIFGFISEQKGNSNQLDGIMQVVIDLRKEAKERRDYVTSDKIRNELLKVGVSIKDEKDGNVSYSIA